MTSKALRKKLKELEACHPEASEAEVWATRAKESIHIKYIGYDKRHKPSRIHLSE